MSILRSTTFSYTSPTLATIQHQILHCLYGAEHRMFMNDEFSRKEATVTYFKALSQHLFGLRTMCKDKT
jgi:hypothetical protein